MFFKFVRLCQSVDYLKPEYRLNTICALATATTTKKTGISSAVLSYPSHKGMYIELSLMSRWTSKSHQMHPHSEECMCSFKYGIWEQCGWLLTLTSAVSLRKSNISPSAIASSTLSRIPYIRLNRRTLPVAVQKWQFHLVRSNKYPCSLSLEHVRNAKLTCHLKDPVCCQCGGSLMKNNVKIEFS